MWKLYYNDKLVATQVGDFMRNLSTRSPYDLFDFGYGRVCLNDFLYWVAVDLGLSTSIKKSELEQIVLNTAFGIITKSGYTVKYIKQ